MANAELEHPDSDHRAWLPKVLLGAFLVLAVLSVVAVWSRNQVLDTDRFVSSVSPLANYPNVQLAISDRMATAISEQVDAQLADRDDQLLDGLLAVPIEFAINEVIRSVSDRVVASEAFADLWKVAARAAHAAMVLALTGGDSDVVVSEEGQVAIDLGPIVSEVWNNVAGDRPELGLTDELPGDLVELQFVLFESDDLASLQRYIRWLDQFATILPILMVLALIGYFIASNDRWRAAVRSSFGLATAMIALLVVIALVRWAYLRRLDADVNPETAEAVFDALTTNLRHATRILALGGFVIAGLVSLGRPGPSGDTGLVAGWQDSIARNRWLSGAILLSAIGIVFIIWDSMPAGWALVLALVAIAGTVIIAVLPGAPPEEVRPLEEIPDTDSAAEDVE